MKHEKSQHLNVWALAIASGIVGLAMALWLSLSLGSTAMGSMMLRFGMPYWHGVSSLWMAVCFAIVGGVLAWLYNAITDRLEK